MSWDVIVLRFPESIQTTADLEAQTEPLPALPLCSVEEFRASSAEAFPGVDWTEPTWGIWRGDEGSVEFNVGREDTVSSAMLHVRAGAPIVARILAMTDAAGWKALDTQAGSLLTGPTDTSGLDSWRTWRDDATRGDA
ncbi:hypothetical protein [Microbacterium sp. 179-I 3D4 NHS]|uniref:hypothetical protein n=1 Tax=Microbacterium sp. 179-I 3D4 NHS TaxID=3142381 RepID=UPI00399FB6A6